MFSVGASNRLTWAATATPVPTSRAESLPSTSSALTEKPVSNTWLRINLAAGLRTRRDTRTSPGHDLSRDGIGRPQFRGRVDLKKPSARGKCHGARPGCGRAPRNQNVGDSVDPNFLDLRRHK